MATAVSTWLALVLAVSAGLKARGFAQAAAALATYGLDNELVRRLATGLLIAAELTLSGALALEASWAAPAATALFALFALATTAALLAGRGGRPCACFASSSRLGWSSPLRAVALAGVAGALALDGLASAPSGYARWLTAGLALSVAAIGALALVVLALAREIGVLRLGMSGRGALEIPEEGPQIGSAPTWAAAVASEQRALLRLAVFTSEGCPLCQALEPAVEHVASDPLLEVRLFDEAADPAVWRSAQVPGSPYGVALSRAGVVLAKGTFNSLGQLESILATARSREREVALAA